MRTTIKHSAIIAVAALAFAIQASAQITPSTKTQTTPAASSTSGAGAAQTAKPATTPQTSAPKPATAQAPGQTPGQAPAAAAPMTEKQKESYALGMNIGRGLSQQLGDLDSAEVVQGLKDTLAKGGKPRLTDDEAMAALKKLETEVQAKEDAMMQMVAEANQKEGDAFLAANKSKEGVTTLPSGLQYKVITPGTGPKPTAADTVVCNYRGTLLNGKEFDSSYKRGQAATFPLSGVIKGWTEGVQLMPVGSKYQFFIPASLAYGGRGAGADIGPNATLVFEIELISIQGK